jgi:cobalamin synthase
MRYEKEDQLELSAWLILIVGLAMGIPGALVFGVVEYVCGYLIFSVLLVLCVLVFGGTSVASRRRQTRAYVEDINLWH